MDKVLISVVSPVYNAEKIIDEFIMRVNESISQITDSYEIILVEDCCLDRSWEKILFNANIDKKLKGIKLSRNFGQHSAIIAGLTVAKGSWVVVMDCDLQDDPNEIEKLYKKTKKGYDIVLARRINRQDNLLKKLFSRWFYKVFGYFTDTEQDAAIANFGIYHRKVINAVLEMGDNIKYFPAMIRWVGFRVAKVAVNHNARFEGESSYSFFKLFSLALDVILSFSSKPLVIITKTGLIISGIAFLAAIVYLWLYLSNLIVVLGFASIIISIFLI